MACRTRQDSCCRSAIYRGWHRSGQGPVQLVRRHRATVAGGDAMNLDAMDFGILGPAFCAGLLVLATHVPMGQQVLARDPHGGEHLKDLLVGQILWVNYRQLLPVALLTAVILALWFGAGARLGRIGFYAIFAFAVTAAVQLVGVYLVFASLIIPALASRFHPVRRQLAIGYSVGVLGYALGLTLSAVFDLPSGAVVVWALAVCGIALAWGRSKVAKPG